jgi:hypothetical protein
MPCGMNFPGGGGGFGSSGCTYGGGNCGGMIYGFDDGEVEASAGAGCAVQPEACPAILIGIGAYGIYEVGERTGVNSVMYSKAKDAANKVGSQVDRALTHIEKLGGPDPNPDPRGGWKQSVRDAANQIDKQADRIPNKTVSNGLRLLADFLRGAIPPD